MLLFVLLGSSAVAWAQDVIVKKDGSTVVCRVVEITDTEVVYKKWADLQGSNYVMERTAVSAVNYQDGRRVDLSTAKNLYKPNNQNDGTQQYNDNALLAIDRAEHPKKKVNFPFKWVVKAGLSLDHVTETKALDLKMSVGFDVAAGLLYPFKNSNFALGLDAYFCTFGAGGLDKVGFSGSGERNFPSLSFGAMPYVGYRFALQKKMSLFPYLGIYAGYASQAYGQQIIELYSIEPFYPQLCVQDNANFGFDIGVNFFLTDKFFINAHYKVSFNKYDEIIPRWTFAPSSRPRKFVIGVGYMF